MTPPKKKSEAEKPTEDASISIKKGPIPPPDMTEELISFITAIDDYKRAHQRPFPSWGEVLDVLKSLGYERPDDD